MTTGNVNTQAVIGSALGYTWRDRVTRSWNGANSPGLPPRSKEYQTVFIPGRKLLSGKWLPPLSYKKRKWSDLPARARKRPENNYSLSTTRTREDFYNYYYSKFSTNRGIIGANGGDPFGVVWSANDDLALIGALREKILGSDFNAGVFLAEAPRAIALIGDSASRIYRAYRSLRKGDVGHAYHSLISGSSSRRVRDSSLPKGTTASNFWLEAQYGWMPLVSDVQNAAQFLAHQFSSPRQYVVTATRFARGTREFRGTHLLSAYTGANFYQVSRKIHSKRVRAIIKDVNTPSLVGLADPVSVAWELVPYSFVADWFIPVGSYLEALNTLRSISATYVTTERKLVRNTFSHATFSDPNARWTTKPAAWEGGTYSFTRTVSTSLSIPLPEVKPFVKSVTLGHAVNAVALLVSRFGSK